ncbi:hypothetical protein [uncultured Methylobacterium sp.]|uniref:hypothetical protein n=1 Tax=uncultured Methylobacterium sp. TaxID=157278 RepID=UPI00259A2D63|nr:hypothetical protein [uncultured Methylobacterium sp.]
MSGVSKKDVVAFIAEQMPDWKLVPDDTAATLGFDDSDMVSSMRSEKGPSVEQLRRKFLRQDVADAPGDANSALGSVDTSVATVRIQPKHGGPAKTADIRDGRVIIVQG